MSGEYYSYDGEDNMSANLKDLTWEDFVKSRATDINTWPYLQSGTLQRHEEYDSSKLTDDILKFQEKEWEDVDRFAELFSEKQKSALGWIFAAFIAIIGNLAVNLGFATPVFKGNQLWMFLCLIVVAILTWVYLMYLPTPSLVFKFVHPYVGFPKGYERRVPPGSCTNPHSRIILQHNHLNKLATSFGVLVRAAILRDHLSLTLENASYIRISNIREISDQLPVYFVTVSTNGIKPWLSPRGREKIRMELRDLVQAFLDTRLDCMVRRFELESTEWNNHGPDFIDGVSDWRFDNMRKEIIDTLQPDDC